MSYGQMIKEFHKAFDLPCPDKITEFTDQLFNLRTKLIEEELEELSNEMSNFEENKENFELHKAVKETVDLVYVLIGMMVSIGIPFDECFNEVHKSNMSKLDDDGKPIYREDGKVLKSGNYVEPNIQGILNKYK